MKILQALKFWNTVYDLFPNQQVYQWMTSLAEGRADWFRNLSLANVAISEHSYNSRGFFSMTLYDQNKARLDKIIEEHHRVTDLMQS